MAEGPELVVNGEFPTNVNSWSFHANGVGGGIQWFAPGDMRVTGSFINVPPPTGPQPGWGNGYQNVTGLTGDTDYICRFEVTLLNVQPGKHGVGGMSTSFQPNNANIVSASLSTLGNKVLPFTTGPGVTSLFAKIVQPSVMPQAFCEVDNISVKEQGVSTGGPRIIFF